MAETKGGAMRFTDKVAVITAFANGIGRATAEIMAREDETGAVKLAPPSFVRGQTVRLLEGPLADMNGLFEEMRDENRAVLLVSLLGRQVRMQVSVAAVTAAA